MPSDLLAQGRDVHRSRRPLDCADRIQLLLHAIAMQVGSCLEVEFAVMQKLGGSGLTDPIAQSQPLFLFFKVEESLELSSAGGLFLGPTYLSAAV